MRKKIDVRNLRMGMFVAELDKPWIETPFLFQGFVLDSKRDMARLMLLCEHVYIDTDKGDDYVETRVQRRVIPATERKTTIQNRQHYYNTPVEDELKVSRDIYSKAKTHLIALFRDIRLGKSVDAVSSKLVVSKMADSIIRNPDALMLLSHLRDKAEQSATHGLNVCILALTFGRHLGFSSQQLREIGIGALLHDIGEIKLPDELLSNRRNLTTEQQALLQTHTQLGYDILSKNPDIPKSAAEIALSHHERKDGSGYPRRLEGDEISYYSKIVGIVNVYDTVTSNYDDRGSVIATDVLKNMYHWRDTLFDADLIEQFIQCIGIYPIGSVIELSTGEVGIVISVPPQHHLSPKIMIVRDSNKNPYYPPRVINMYDLRDSEEADDIEIIRVLPPDAFGIDLKSYLLREAPAEVH